MSDHSDWNRGCDFRVLFVSGHWSAKANRPCAGIFVDRQLASLKKKGIEMATFDVGRSHNPFSLFRKWIKLQKLIKRFQPHLVHGQYGTMIGFLAAFSGAPSVISFCGSDLLPGASVSWVRMYLGFLLSNLAALRANKIICKSQELRNALWWKKNEAVVIPNGVDLDMFSPGSQDEARRKLDWKMDCPVVLFYVGQDERNKGLDIAKASMEIVQKKIPKAELCIFSKVEPDQMPLYYRAGDVLLCASRQEGSPNVVKEALACNLPIVSSLVGDVGERLTGVFPSEVVARSPQAMGEALIRVLGYRRRSNGRDSVAALSLEVIAKRVLDVYQSCGCTNLSK
ncbi:MAG: glycosyltransferase [Nitrospira sp.]|nr:glycosyltransferase [Nitrospira sp.]